MYGNEKEKKRKKKLKKGRAYFCALRNLIFSHQMGKSSKCYAFSAYGKYFTNQLYSLVFYNIQSEINGHFML